MPAQEHLVGQFTDRCQESIDIPLPALTHDDAIGSIRANELRAEPNSDLMRFGNDVCDCYEDNFLLHFSQKPWYTAYEVRAVQFRPFVYDTMNRRVPVTIEPMTPQDAATTTKEPRWQTDWSSEYISKGKFDVYGLKTQIGELVALGAYEISEDVVTVHIVYMESQAQSNPTLCERPKYHGIGRALIAYGIKLSVDAGFNGDVTLDAKTPELARHYERDFGALLIPGRERGAAPRYLICDEAARDIFVSYLEEG